jgi:hypothetical protein
MQRSLRKTRPMLRDISGSLLSMDVEVVYIDTWNMKNYIKTMLPLFR